MGNSPVTLATAATARMTQQFWFRCVHPSSPVSAKGPEVLPAASRKPACLLQAPGPQLASPQHPHFCKPLTKAEIGWSSCLWGWAAATAMPPGSPGPLLHTGTSPPSFPMALNSHPPFSRDRKGLVLKAHRAETTPNQFHRPPRTRVILPALAAPGPSSVQVGRFTPSGLRWAAGRPGGQLQLLGNPRCPCAGVRSVSQTRGKEGRGQGKAWTVC